LQTALGDTIKYFMDKSTSAPSTTKVLGDWFKLTKALTELAKRTNLNSELAKKLKQCCDTRWNSNLKTIESVIENKNQIYKVR
jgi:hypothetical protein